MSDPKSTAARIPLGSLAHYENATEEIYRREYGDLVQIRAGQREFLTLRVGDGPYAVELHGILEITRASAITPVPFSPTWVLGVMMLRGNVVPVFHVRRMLGLGGARNAHPERVLLVGRTKTDAAGGEGAARRGTTPVGLLVDAVREVISVPDEAIGSVSGDVSAPGAALLKGVARRVRAERTEEFTLLDHVRMANAVPDDPVFAGSGG